ncbi:MAG: hypothetical protein H0U64_02535, partial [Gemmatimonadaceae bacterium]|nr:hypothetical protein [Gemmatimonadaceae bacterium]
DLVLQRERAARVVQSALHESNPLTLSEIVDALATPQWTSGASRPANLRSATSDRIVQRSVADRMLAIASDKDASPEVRSLIEFKMRQLRDRARTLLLSGSIDDRAHWASVSGDFTRWLERQELPTPSPALRAPPGDPFGGDGQ